MSSFRPLTGLLFFYLEKEAKQAAKDKEFPSPYGAFVFLPLRRIRLHQGYTAFPSPYGAFVFLPSS